MAIDINKLDNKQLADLRNRIDARQETMRKDSLVALRNKITSMVAAAGFSMDEVLGNRTRRGVKHGKVPPKYANPADTQQTWSGRGKRPNWFLAALKSGKKEKDLLIK